MTLNTLLKEIGMESPFGGVTVTAVTDVAEDVVPGCVFVAVAGDRTDGNRFIGRALSMGAAAVVTAKGTGSEREIVVRDPRRAYSILCAAFYGHPDRDVRLIGITGTNGKTTTAEYLKTVLERTGRRCGVIGTLGCGVDGDREDSGYTTPESGTFFAALRRMAEEGCAFCAAEVSSQALAQCRVDAARFSLGVLTNIGTDHLDYHGRLSDYVSAKSRLFRLSDRALLNADDAYCETIAREAGLTESVTYAVRGGYADFTVKNLRQTDKGCHFLIAHGTEAVSMALPPVCDFTVYNVLAAVAAACMAGVPLADAADALRELPPVKGRMQPIRGRGMTVYIDFAHTPEALAGALKGLRRLCGGRLIAVFGCGGDRDRGKRPEMGRIAASYADLTVVTSDNPRGEDPMAIIADVLAGTKGRRNVLAEPDRARAIALAVEQAAPGDTVLVAGKGHEEYQIVSGRKSYFSDEDVVRELLGAQT